MLWSHVPGAEIGKRPLSERSEFRTLPDFGTGDVGTRSEAEGSIFGVAFSWLLLLLDFPHFCRLVGKLEEFYPEASTPQREVHHEIAPRAY